MNITIEPMNDSHITAYHHVLNTVCRERRYLIHTQAPSLDELAIEINTALASNNAQFIAVAHNTETSRNHLVGWCQITPNQEEGFTHIGSLSLGVLPNYRSRGIGRKLLQATLNHAHDQGLTRIEADIFASNIPCIRLLESFLFAHEGFKERARFLDGNYDSLVSMALISNVVAPN
ncbi:Acetyltransferase (GNAT) family protein [Poriferisphaera corsica]|uniref:Acetyltransferase (GNAT) family protein n=1 Tax=Poriferisphaera corsica TaxID=2528020 RepID=A0A517YT63_9BACT|nr:GNAT family N-acetyltransferase [Poriferisphaera corsica]QDU33416.1 Acetyltransferase (GNAT) family protein [Poriferisphaera corsica]